MFYVACRIRRPAVILAYVILVLGLALSLPAPGWAVGDPTLPPPGAVRVAEKSPPEPTPAAPQVLRAAWDQAFREHPPLSVGNIGQDLKPRGRPEHGTITITRTDSSTQYDAPLRGPTTVPPSTVIADHADEPRLPASTPAGRILDGDSFTSQERNELRKILAINRSTPSQVALVNLAVRGTALFAVFMVWLLCLVIFRRVFNYWWDADVYRQVWPSTLVIVAMLYCTAWILRAAM